LCKRPMVVAYRMATLTYWLAKWLVRLPHFSLPNLLARRELVPEFLQHEATPQNLAKAVNYWLENPEKVRVLQHQFYDLHAQLKRGASEEAARAIVGLLRGH
jgi:lipid-A-disaccharide synthase